LATRRLATRGGWRFFVMCSLPAALTATVGLRSRPLPVQKNPETVL
jgi:hypothetical protein